ncbi:energy-coupling factor transporter transmembrane component T [Microbacterium sp. X-17]|uniref:energy-coupling factor transporter transmembrane component T family protein n=1 Tax=Microbacterium sp. X-17 TaxID=3144404 RepID=UPI0031F583F7
MLSLYRPGNGWLHRTPAGPKTVLVLALVLAVSLLPSTWWAAAVAAGAGILVYAAADLRDGALGMRELARQVHALRWILLFTIATQLFFLGPELAVANTVRLTAAVALAGLLVLTTTVTALLDALERSLRPLARIRLSPERAALLLTVTIGTIPVLGRLAREIRDAQRARGVRSSLRTFVVPFLVVALKHADELGDALTARGVR